jgi:hypothetical protein
MFHRAIAKTADATSTILVLPVPWAADEGSLVGEYEMYVRSDALRRTFWYPFIQERPKGTEGVAGGGLGLTLAIATCRQVCHCEQQEGREGGD